MILTRWDVLIFYVDVAANESVYTQHVKRNEGRYSRHFSAVRNDIFSKAETPPYYKSSLNLNLNDHEADIWKECGRAACELSHCTGWKLLSKGHKTEQNQWVSQLWINEWYATLNLPCAAFHDPRQRANNWYEWIMYEQTPTHLFVYHGCTGQGPGDFNPGCISVEDFTKRGRIYWIAQIFLGQKRLTPWMNYLIYPYVSFAKRWISFFIFFKPRMLFKKNEQ